MSFHFSLFFIFFHVFSLFSLFHFFSVEIEDSLNRIDKVISHFLKIHSVEVQNEFEETQNFDNRQGRWRADWDTIGEGEYKGGETSGEEGTLQV